MPQVIRIADCPPVPWKNGAGTTRELWALRDATGAPRVRISIAEIRGAQAFSRFPGTDRVILQLDGPPMVLTIDGTAHKLMPHAPLAFPGEAQVTCLPEGAGVAHDLNLMCRRGDFAAGMRLLETRPGSLIETGAPDGITALLALAPTTLHLPIKVTLATHDLLVAHGVVQVRTPRAAAFADLTARRAAQATGAPSQPQSGRR